MEIVKRKKVIMANKLTLRVIKTAFYNGVLVQPNEIIKNYKGDTVPSWATLANGKEAPVKKDEGKEEGKKEEVKDETSAEDEVETEEAETDTETEEAEADAEAEETEADAEDAGEEKTEEALLEEYNALLDEAVDKNIILEDADKKTVVEQIAELKTLLGKE